MAKGSRKLVSMKHCLHIHEEVCYLVLLPHIATAKLESILETEIRKNVADGA
jgi:hypothetical protein